MGTKLLYLFFAFILFLNHHAPLLWSDKVLDEDISRRTATRDIRSATESLSVSATPAPTDKTAEFLAASPLGREGGRWKEKPPVPQNQTVSATSNQPKEIVLVATDPNGDPITYKITSPCISSCGTANAVYSTSTGGTVTRSYPADSSKQNYYTYTPKTNFTGTDSFTFKANDGKADSISSATVTINVASANQAPIANPVAPVSVNEDSSQSITLGGTDPDGTNPTIAAGSPLHGTLTLDPGDPSKTHYVYTPNADYNGADSFTYRVYDGILYSDPVTVNITVSPVNDTPVAKDFSFDVAAGQTFSGRVTATDVDGDSLTYAVFGTIPEGLTFSADGTFTYFVPLDFTGPLTFQYKAKDSHAVESEYKNVTLTLKPVIPETSFYVNLNIESAGDGSTWASAMKSLPSTLVRGAVYYLAAGSYGSYTFDDALDGDKVITIRKATREDHGTSAGWNDALADNPAVFTNLVFSTGNYVVDGQTGNGASDMPYYASYGIRVIRTNTADGQSVIRTLSGSDNIILRHVEAAYSNTPRTDTWYHSAHILRTESGTGTVTVEYGWFHDAGGCIYNGYASNIIFDHSVLERNGQAQVAMKWDPSEHSEIAAIKGESAAVFRYSVIRDWRSTGGLIAGFSAAPASVTVYGSVFEDTGYWVVGVEANDSNGAISGLSAGIDLTYKVYNNTFVNLRYGAQINTSGTYLLREAKNNIFYNCHQYNDGTPGAVRIGGTHDYNWFYNSGSQSEPHMQIGTGDPFLDSLNGDFRLRAAIGGADSSIDPEYATDAFGITRGADGLWDIGAYEYF